MSATAPVGETLAGVPGELPRGWVSAPVEQLSVWLRKIAGEEGVSPEEILDALRPVMGAVLARRARILGARAELVRTLTPPLTELDPVPHAVVDQARRLAELRAGLLSTGAHTYRSLADGRGAREETVRQSVRRARDRCLLFTVTHDGETLVPAFLLDERLEPNPIFAPAIRPLREAGEDGWALWAWFVTPSAWLSGDIPAEVVGANPERVYTAARRRASNAA